MGDNPRPITLAFVDDDPDIIRIVSKVLETGIPENVQITAMSSAQEAREFLDRRHCDVLISDIEMPGMDGIQMLKLAKSRNPWARVIFMTAHSTWDRISEAIELGAADYLMKPLKPSELRLLVTQECERTLRWKQALRRSLEMARA